MTAPAITDEELARYLDVNVETVRKLPPEARAAHEKLILAEFAIKLWRSGQGPRPPGVIVCRERVRPRRGLRH